MKPEFGLGRLVRKTVEHLRPGKKEPEMVQIYLKLICGHTIPSRIVLKGESVEVEDLIAAHATVYCPIERQGQQIIDWEIKPVTTPARR